MSSENNVRPDGAGAEEEPPRAAGQADAAEAPEREARPRGAGRVRVADLQHWLDLCP
jgi:hypothetical protein